MAALNEVLSLESEAWALRLRTAADPDSQLSGLAALLGKPASDPSFAPGFEIKAPQPKVNLAKPVFENCLYSLRVAPAEGWLIQSVRHPVLKELEDSLDLDEGIYRGTLRTGNDIGWYSLEIVVQPKAGGPSRVDSVAWLVRPLKLDYSTDLISLTKAVEKEYPLWLFKFRVPTAHNAAASRSRGERFLLLWAAQFQILRDDLELGCRIVAQNPQISLVGETHNVRADRLKGLLPRSCEERLAENRHFPDHRYAANLWRSSLDTPENRFVAHVLDACVSGLQRFREAIDFPGLAPSFIARVEEWSRSLRTIRSDPMFRSLSDFTGMAGESLVLQNKAGYSKVYRAWLELRHYLDFFARSRDSRIGMRSISELYEIWCFLEIRSIVAKLPGFIETAERAPRWRRGAIERELENGQGSAFRFEGPNGVRISLAHEPVYSRKGDPLLSSLTVAQKPDIVLEALWPATWERPERKLLWIFDAKYRIKTGADERGWDSEESSTRPSEDRAPPDAIDQMHRYRDAIFLGGERERTRPVVSAFALYPGRFDQTQPSSKNPYAISIEQVGIGAFPLIPGENGNAWLKAHLAKELNVASPLLITRKHSVRIPVSGLSYPEEDVLIVFLTTDRSAGYLERFRSGQAAGYHTYVVGGPNRARLEKVRFLAAIDVPGADHVRRIVGAYALSGAIKVVNRSSLSSAETGAARPRNVDKEVYWLPLGNFLRLQKPLEVQHGGGNWFRYASLQRLFEAEAFSQVWLLPNEE
jgi:predicted component of viral defense system (DUF524 family)